MATMDIATLGLEVDARRVREGDRALNDFERTSGRTERTTEQLNGTLRRLAAAMAAAFAAISLTKLIEMADLYANLTGRLKLVTNSTQELTAAHDKLFAIAQRTQTSLAGTINLYTKMTGALRELGVTEAQRLRVTETINKAMVVSGASAAEQTAALGQLGQALASGTLRGDEFNSVNEAAPRLMDAIAAGLGRTKGELRAMAEQGQITSTAIVSSLTSQSAAIDAEFTQLPLTVGGALTMINNAMLRTVGVFDQNNQLSAGLAQNLAYLAENFNKVVAAAGGLAVMALGRWFAGVTTEIYRKVAATGAEIAATRTSAAAALAAATARATETAAAVAATSARLAEARAATLAASGDVQLALATNALIPAQARAAAAASAHAAALRAQAAAAATAAGAAGWGARLLGMLGGPIGIVTTLLGLGAAAWLAWGNKAEESTEETKKSVNEETEEVIASLDKQIAKIEERNRLFGVAPEIAKGESREAEQQRAILAEINRIGKDTTLNETAKIELLKLQGEQWGRLTERMERAAAGQKKLDANMNAAKAGEWLEKNSQYMTQAERLAHAINKAKQELGAAFTPAHEERIRNAFSAKIDNQRAKDYEQAAEKARDYVKGLEDERRAIGATEEQQTLLAAGRAAALAPTSALAAKILETAQALVVERRAFEDTEAAREAAVTEQRALADASAGRVKAAQDAVASLQKEIETYGMGAEAVAAYTLAKLNDRLTSTVNADERNEIEKLIAATMKLRDLQAQKAALDELFAEDKAESFGDALRNSFGEAGNALAQLTNVMQDFHGKERAAEKARALALRKHGGDEKKAAREIGKINNDLARDRIDGWANMAGAAKGFFSENSKGYKALEAVERGFRAWEMAVTLENMYAQLMATSAVTAARVAGSTASAAAATAGATVEVGANAAIGASAAAAGVANQAKGDPYTAFARMAAMAAMMAALGFAVAGGGGGKSLSQQRQETQGTGSVLGDANAKSESIAKSLELVSKNSDIELNYTAGMLSALRNIENSLAGLGGLLVRNAGISGSSFVGNDKSGLGGALQSIFGGKRTAEDSGFMVGPASVAAILASGVNAQRYTDVKKSGGWFSSSKRWTETEALGREANEQIAAVVRDLAGGLGEAAKLLGVGGDAFNARLAAFVVDIGKVSLKDLSAADVEKEIAAVFSKLGDDMSAHVFPTLRQFQQVGEGMFETVTRVATNYSNLDSALRGMDATFGATGVESLAARERLIALTGGIESLADQARGFAENYLTEEKRLEITRAYVVEQMAALGLAHVQNREQFAATVMSIDKTTEAGARQWAAMMALQQVFADAYPLADKAADAIDDTADKLAELAEKAQAVADALRSNVDAAFDTLSQVVEREKNAAEKAHELAMKQIDDQITTAKDAITRHRALADSLKSTLDKLVMSGQEAATRGAAQAQIKAALVMARAGALPAADSLRGALEAVSRDASDQFANAEDYRRDFYRTAHDLAALGTLADTALDVDERTLAALEEQRKVAEAAHAANIARLDGILENARRQVELLDGVSTSLVSLRDALNSFELAVQTARANPLVGAAGPMAQAYQIALGRTPEAAAIANANAQVAAGTPMSSILTGVYASNEAKVVALFRDILQRDPATEGRKFWTQALNNGVSYESVRDQIANSAEARAKSGSSSTDAGVKEEVAALRQEITSGLMSIARHTSTTAKGVEQMVYQENSQ